MLDDFFIGLIALCVLTLTVAIITYFFERNGK